MGWNRILPFLPWLHGFFVKNASLQLDEFPFILGAQFSTEPWSCGRKGKALRGSWKTLTERSPFHHPLPFGAPKIILLRQLPCVFLSCNSGCTFFNLVTYLNLLQNKHRKKNLRRCVCGSKSMPQNWMLGIQIVLSVVFFWVVSVTLTNCRASCCKLA